MKISKKSQYGLRGLIRLAKADEFLSMKKVAEEENISSDYLEKIFSELEKQKIIKSKRGPSGGYRLALEPVEINLKMILNALETNLTLVECLEGECNRLDDCLAAPVWEYVDSKIKEELKNINLKKLIDKKYE